MDRIFGDLVTMSEAPALDSSQNGIKKEPMLVYCTNVEGDAWRYDTETKFWQSLVEPEMTADQNAPATELLKPTTTVLLIADNNRETFITFPPSNQGRPVKIFTPNCDVLIIEAREEGNFPLVFKNLLNFSEPSKMAYFQRCHADPILKLDDMIYASTEATENFDGDLDKLRFMALLRDMPLSDLHDSQASHQRVVDQFRFVEAFLTSKERGLQTLPLVMRWAFTLPELSSMSNYKEHDEIPPFQEKKLWRDCARVTTAWGRSASIDASIKYSMISSFYLQAATIFEVRSIGLMDKARIIVNEIELSIHRVVKGILKQKYGNDYRFKFKPEGLREELSKRRQYDSDKLEVMNQLFLKEYKCIVEAQKAEFGSTFNLDCWNDYRRSFTWMFRENLSVSGLKWYDALCYLRNRVCHPTKKPLSPEEFRFLEDVKRHFDSVESTVEV